MEVRQDVGPVRRRRSAVLAAGARVAWRPRSAAMKRPFGVTIIGVLLTAQGLYLVALPLAVIFLEALPGANSFRPPRVFDFAGLSLSEGFPAIFIGALGVFIVASGIGVLRLRPFSWLAAMAFRG